MLLGGGGSNAPGMRVSETGSSETAGPQWLWEGAGPGRQRDRDVESGATVWGEGRCWHLPPSHPSRKVLCCRELLGCHKQGFPDSPSTLLLVPASLASLPVPSLLPSSISPSVLEQIYFPSLEVCHPNFLFVLIVKCSVPYAQARKRLKPPSLCLLLEGWVSQGMSQLTGRD